MEALRETIAERMRAAFREVRDWATTRARIAADHEALAKAIAAGDADAAERTVDGAHPRVLRAAARQQRLNEETREERMSEEPIRVLLAKVGLDGHDRGVKVVARALRDAGMEVVYTGLHRSPEEVVAAATQEDVDVIGVSLLSGAHMALFPRIIDLMKEQEIFGDHLLLGGGVIPDEDVEELKSMGVDEIMGQDTPPDAIVELVRTMVAERGVALVECWSFPPRYDEAYTPPPDQEYWFPERETMDPDERDARILERLREVCAYALRALAVLPRASGATSTRAPTSRTLRGLRARCP